MDCNEDEERNYYCLWLLLMRVGTPKLRTYFKRKWDTPAAGRRVWTDCPANGADLMRLWKPKIHLYENAKVNSGDTSKWDLSLFVKILSPNEPRRCCTRALDKLKDLRNSLCHSHQAKLTDRDFQRMWNDACNVLVLFGATSEDFKKVKKDAKQPLKDFKPVVVKWLAQEFELLHNGQLLLLQELEKLKEGQCSLFDKIRELKADMQHATAGTTDEPNPSLNPFILDQLPKETTQSTDREGEALTTYLKNYYRTGERALLLPLPWMEGDEFRIDSIYTPTKMVKMYTEYDTSLERIFAVEAETDMKKIRRILIEGEPGIGKSAICKKIAYDWSTNNTPSLFPSFEVVLSLRCRDFNTSCDLWDAIEMQTFSDDLKEKRDEIFAYIRNNQNKVLLILDGYDEISDECSQSMKQSIKQLIQGQLLEDCNILVTSRPEKSSKIRNLFDRKLEIKGFELENTFAFIRHFFASTPENVDPVLQFIENREGARDLVRSPLYTAILCLQRKNNDHHEELSILSLGKDIVSSIIKRYCIEKLGEEEVNDDDIPSVTQGKLYNLGKVAYMLTKYDRGNTVEETELRKIVNPIGLIAFFIAFLGGVWFLIRKVFWKESLGDKVHENKLIREFLVFKKPVNEICTTSRCTFPHWVLQKHLAADYVKQSFAKSYYREWKVILTFKDRATFLRVVSIIYFVIKRSIQDKSLTKMQIVSLLSAILLLVLQVTRAIYELQKSYNDHVLTS